MQLRARLVERPPQRGQPRKGTTKELMVLLTNLRKEDGFDSSTLIKMYVSRWGIETAIRELKSFMGLEPFHTMTVEGVEQEIAASLVWMAMGSMLQIRAEDGMPPDRRVIRTDCLRAATSLVEDWMKGESIVKGEEIYIESLRRFWNKDRPGRYYERKCQFPHGRSVGNFG